MNTKMFLAVVLLLAAAVAAAAAPEPAAEPGITLELRDADARSALEALFRAGDKQFVLESGVSGSVGSVSFKDTPFESALRQLTRSAGLTYRIVDGCYTVGVKQKPQIETAPTPAPYVLQDLPVVAEDTIVEKVRLFHTSAYDIITTLQQGQAAGGVTAWSNVGGGMQQPFGQSQGVPMGGPMGAPSQSYRTTGVASPSVGSYGIPGGRQW